MRLACIHSPFILFKLTAVFNFSRIHSPLSLLKLTLLPVEAHHIGWRAVLVLSFGKFKVYKVLRCLLFKFSSEAVKGE